MTPPTNCRLPQYHDKRNRFSTFRAIAVGTLFIWEEISMKRKERTIRILLIVLAVAIPLISVIYTNLTGNYFSETSSKLMLSCTCLLLIGALLVGINQNFKTKPIKIGAIAGLTVLLILRWI